MSDGRPKTLLEAASDSVQAFKDLAATLGLRINPYRTWPDVAALACTLTFIAFVLWLVL